MASAGSLRSSGRTGRPKITLLVAQIFLTADGHTNCNINQKKSCKGFTMQLINISIAAVTALGIISFVNCVRAGPIEGTPLTQTKTSQNAINCSALYLIATASAPEFHADNRAGSRAGLSSRP